MVVYEKNALGNTLPEFNASFEFLRRINWHITELGELLKESKAEDMPRVLRVVQVLYIELSPRMTESERNRIRTMINDPKVDNWALFAELNTSAHRLGLIMKDREVDDLLAPDEGW